MSTEERRSTSRPEFLVNCSAVGFHHTPSSQSFSHCSLLVSACRRISFSRLSGRTWGTPMHSCVSLILSIT